MLLFARSKKVGKSVGHKECVRYQNKQICNTEIYIPALLYPMVKLCDCDQLSDIFDDEAALLDILVDSQPPAP